MPDNNIRKSEKTIRIASYCLPALALILSALSATDLCMGGCSALSNYRMFGAPFAVTGIAYFSLILGALYVANRHEKFQRVVDLLIAAGLGAEIWFIAIQKFVVRKWCPVCLSIAAMLLALAILRAFRAYMQRIDRKHADTPSNKGVLVRAGKAATLAVLSAGFMTAIVSVGFKKVNLNEQAIALETAAVKPAKTSSLLSVSDIWFGDKKSPVEVYFVTDWYCAYCRKVEPVIEKSLPELGQTARYTWVDMAIHRESVNLIPFGLNVLLHDKGHYLMVRHALLELTKEGKETPELQIRSAIKAAGANVPEADKEKLSAIYTNTLMFIRASGVNQTPSVIVIDTRTGSRQVLSGAEQITEANLLNAVGGGSKR